MHTDHWLQKLIDWHSKTDHKVKCPFIWVLRIGWAFQVQAHLSWHMVTGIIDTEQRDTLFLGFCLWAFYLGQETWPDHAMKSFKETQVLTCIRIEDLLPCSACWWAISEYADWDLHFGRLFLLMGTGLLLSRSLHWCGFWNFNLLLLFCLTMIKKFFIVLGSCSCN